MADEVNIILEKKLDNYYYACDNLTALNEITVTITLHEYRELIKENATNEAEKRKLRDEIYSLKAEINKLKEKITSLVGSDEISEEATDEH